MVFLKQVVRQYYGQLCFLIIGLVVANAACAQYSGTECSAADSNPLLPTYSVQIPPTGNVGDSIKVYQTVHFSFTCQPKLTSSLTYYVVLSDGAILPYSNSWGGGGYVTAPLSGMSPATWPTTVDGIGLRVSSLIIDGVSKNLSASAGGIELGTYGSDIYPITQPAVHSVVYTVELVRTKPLLNIAANTALLVGLPMIGWSPWAPTDPRRTNTTGVVAPKILLTVATGNPTCSIDTNQLNQAVTLKSVSVKDIVKGWQMQAADNPITITAKCQTSMPRVYFSFADSIAPGNSNTPNLTVLPAERGLALQLKRDGNNPVTFLTGCLITNVICSWSTTSSFLSGDPSYPYGYSTTLMPYYVGTGVSGVRAGAFSAAANFSVTYQ